MPHSVHFVLSIPPAGVSEHDYSTFYETHLDEILETPGWVAARRYWLEPASTERPRVDYRHLSLYVMDRPSEEPLVELERRMGAGEMTIPDWFGDIRFASWDGRPLEDPELDPPDHGYLVLSHAPRRFSTEEFYGWYYAHARENLTSDGFDTVWRYALAPGTVDPSLPAATHAAFYQVHGELPTLRSALVESHQAGRVDIPDWMPEGEFVSWECLSAGPVHGTPVRS